MRLPGASYTEAEEAAPAPDAAMGGSADGTDATFTRVWRAWQPRQKGDARRAAAVKRPCRRRDMEVMMMSSALSGCKRLRFLETTEPERGNTRSQLASVGRAMKATCAQSKIGLSTFAAACGSVIPDFPFINAVHHLSGSFSFLMASNMASRLPGVGKPSSRERPTSQSSGRAGGSTMRRRTFKLKAAAMLVGSSKSKRGSSEVTSSLIPVQSEFDMRGHVLVLNWGLSNRRQWRRLSKLFSRSLRVTVVSEARPALAALVDPRARVSLVVADLAEGPESCEAFVKSVREASIVVPIMLLVPSIEAALSDAGEAVTRWLLDSLCCNAPFAPFLSIVCSYGSSHATLHGVWSCKYVDRYCVCLYDGGAIGGGGAAFCVFLCLPSPVCPCPSPLVEGVAKHPFHMRLLLSCIAQR
jgi:hypothetical protein